ncbi:hypothetical protein GCM10007047_19180 [Cerasicoccus arenae]|uniref:Uncharacterized protein n=2 Tax=Cerasicoccus arenae TaxID=424488 RepID=A0A8J3GEE2_9BACT|nr:hypothetical protein GCM10007047_19180 [Cerasicoccus arenae]
MIYLIPSLRYNQLEFSREEAETRTQEVRERAEAIREQQKKERAERQLSEAHARELTEEIEKKERQEITRQLQNVREVYEKLEAERLQKLEHVENRSLAERLNKQLEPLRRDMERTLEKIDDLEWLEADKDLGKQVPEGFAESLQKDRKKFEELLEQLDEGYNKDTLDEVMDAAKSLVEKTSAVELPQNKAFDARRRQILWAARDSLNKANELIDAPDQITAEQNAKTNENAQATLPEPIAETLEQTDNKSIAELHDAAQQLEQLINESIDGSRAAELAMRQGTDIESARTKLIPSESQMSDIPALRAPDTPTTLGELDQRKEAVNEAARQVSQLNQRANQMAQQLNSNQSRDSATMSPSTSLNQALQNRLHKASSESQPGEVQDVSALMRMAMSQSGSDSSGPEGQEYRNIEGSPESANDFSPDSKQVVNLDGINITANALPGRRFSASSSRQGWLYLDTWYVIGPWDNDGDLRSFDIPLPPESEINFDGAYTGKVYTPQHARQDSEQGIIRGYTLNEPRTLRWNFIQSDSIRTMVPDEVSNATYYLHTDIYFEEARDMLIAIGSDDSAKVWINGFPVWQDSGQSRWALGEHFNKVYFKQGYNSILVRLENGPQRCELSFLICPPEINKAY